MANTGFMVAVNSYPNNASNLRRCAKSLSSPESIITTIAIAIAIAIARAPKMRVAYVARWHAGSSTACGKLGPIENLGIKESKT